MVRVAAILGAFTLLVGIAPSASADPGAGRQYVRTQSGAVRCIVISAELNNGDSMVTCEHGPGFAQAPVGPYGEHFDEAVIRASGAFSWNNANLGGGGTPQNDMVLNYGQTYHVLGWTIVPTSDGTRFTNDGTGHGMFVSIDNVKSF
ncbi:MAG: hypothetical protein CK431_04825 [Mycobacterium sp.]|nr:MAG: hypothetical protein CK431_04825 [Mycobacterium sp.]